MTIQEIEQKLNECQKALAELKESKKEGKWKPEEGERYWLRDMDGDCACCDRYEGDKCDDWRVNNLPIFKTREECERYWHFMDTVKEKSYEFSKEEWEDIYLKKNIICHSILHQNYYVTSVYNNKYLGQIYFKTEADAQYIIDNFKEELMTYWL